MQSVKDQDMGIDRVEPEPLEIYYTTLSKELSHQAASELGYRPQENRLLDYSRRELARALKDADIQPLHKAQVEKYKHRKRFFARAHHWFWATWSVAIIGQWCALVPVGGIHHPFVFWFGTTYAGFVCALFVHALSHLRGRDRWDWRSQPLHGYTSHVPEFALCYALGIKKVNPSVTFRVEELTQDPRPDAFFVDPFLIVELGEASEYIAVWDEPKFEGR